METCEIKARLRQRPPFLFVDRILECEEGVWAKGLKNVTANEAFFAGHFPGEPIVPGVILLEAMAQLSNYLCGRGKAGYFTSVYKARFTRKVLPGDQMVIETRLVKKKRNLLQTESSITVDGKKVAGAELGFMIFDESEEEKHSE